MSNIITKTAAILAAAGIFATFTACGNTSDEEPIAEAEITTIETTVTTMETATTEATTTETATTQTEATTTATEPAGIIDTGITEAYQTAFLTYAHGIGTMTYTEAKEYAESLGLEAEYVEPTADDLGQITIYDSTGDYVWAMTYPNSKNVETLCTVTYNHGGEYEISTGDDLHLSSQYFNTYSKKRDPANQKVSSIEKLEIFMFGETSGASVEVDSMDYSLPNGELLDTKLNSNTLIIKAKISPKSTNDKTINQNYSNIVDLVKNQGCDKYDAIEYWAVADMSDGSESKVISFTVPDYTIDNITIGTVTADNMGSYVDDLYIHESLR